jgi:YVTN family beta-propeller protein
MTIMKPFPNFQQLRFGLRILTLGLLLALTAAMAVAQQRNDNAYVVNITTVSVIDTKSNILITTIAPPITGPADLVGAAVTPEGSKVYLTNAGFGVGNTVLVLDAATNTVMDTIQVGNGPIFDAVTPDGKKVYVVNSTDNTTSVINTATNSVVATIPVGIFPLAVTVSPDGAFAYVANTFSNNVSVIDTASDVVVATVPVIKFPIAVIVSPDSSRVYVANFSSQKVVSVIDAASNTVKASISVGSFPDGLILTPNGRTL